jgi:hypothetical protein
MVLMAIPVAELETMRDALIRARSSGVRVVMVEGKRLEYATDAEMAAAIANLEARIARATGKGLAARFVTFRRT